MLCRFPDPEAIEVLSSSEPGPSHSGLPNIAMAIDPTYPRRATITHTSTYNTSVVETPPSNISSPAVSLPPPGKYRATVWFVLIYPFYEK